MQDASKGISSLPLSDSLHAQLGYLGLTPFVSLTLLYLVYPASTLKLGFLLYSISIISFVAGSLWRPEGQSSSSALFTLIPSALIPAGVLLPVDTGFILLTLLYFVMLIGQRFMDSWEKLPVEYQAMRWRVSLGVMLCHLVVLFRG